MRAAVSLVGWTYCKKYIYEALKQMFLQSSQRDIILGSIHLSCKVRSPLNHYNPRMPTQGNKYLFIAQRLLHVFYNLKTIWSLLSYFRDGKWSAILSWGTWPRNLTILRMEPSLSTPTKKMRTRRQHHLKRVAWKRVNQTTLIQVFKDLRLEAEFRLGALLLIK